MAIVQLPVTSDRANYEFKTTLDGEKYTFAFRFNNRAGRWFMAIKTAAGAVIVAGIPLLTGVDFLAQFPTKTDFPQGRLFLVNLTDENASPGRDDLGVNTLLMYEEAA
jgi:hypothetical protein